MTIEQVIITSNAVRAENIKSLTQGVAEFSSNQQKRERGGSGCS
ncbi:hypothetical protein O9929_12290 [Vibrio lentus]|nr:hypothetical protein [Vibrio lentus]